MYSVSWSACLLTSASLLAISRPASVFCRRSTNASRTSARKASGASSRVKAGITPSSLRSATCSLTADNTRLNMSVKVWFAFGSMPRAVSALVTASRTARSAPFSMTSRVWIRRATALISSLSVVAFASASRTALLMMSPWRLRFCVSTFPPSTVILTPLAENSLSRFSEVRSTSAASRDLSQKFRTSSAERFSPRAIRSAYARSSPAAGVSCPVSSMKSMISSAYRRKRCGCCAALSMAFSFSTVRVSFSSTHFDRSLNASAVFASRSALVVAPDRNALTPSLMAGSLRMSSAMRLLSAFVCSLAVSAFSVRSVSTSSTDGDASASASSRYCWMFSFVSL